MRLSPAPPAFNDAALPCCLFRLRVRVRGASTVTFQWTSPPLCVQCAQQVAGKRHVRRLQLMLRIRSCLRIGLH